MCFKFLKSRSLLSKLLSSLFVITISFGIIGGCGGANPPFAPFGSTVTILDPPGDVTIPPDTVITRTVEAIVLDPDGFPINDVRVTWDLSFAGINDLVVDTDGDSVADEQAIQLFDPEACGDTSCALIPLPQLVAMGAVFFSPLETITDDRGISTVGMIISGNVTIDPASLEASTGSGSVDVQEFSVNTN